MRSSRRLSPPAAALLAAVVLASPAGATVNWYEHYQHGLQAAEAGRFEEALREMRAAASQEPVPRKRAITYGQNWLAGYDPYYHIARCLVELDRPLEAIAPLAHAQRAGVTPQAKIDELRRLLRQAADRLPPEPAPTIAPQPVTRLAVGSDPPGAAVSLDGAPLGTTPVPPAPVAPGRHSVRVTHAAYRPWEREVEVEAGTTHSLDATLVSLLVPTAGVPAPALAAAAASAPPPVAPTAVPPRPTLAGAPLAVPAATATAVPVATAAPGSPPPAPTVFRPLEVPPGAHGPRLLPVAAIAIAIAAATVVGWRSRRRRRPLPPATTAPTRVDDIATLIGPSTPTTLYHVLGMLGRGGMATTYRARRKRDGSMVALKVPHESCLAEETFVSRFLREGQLGEQLHHPRIVRILEAGEEGGRPYLAMELLEGRTLKQELRESGPLPLARALGLARDVAEALDYAHAKGVVHRDLKPDNIMLLASGDVKVMDFGIARLAGQEGLTATNLFLGTPLYAAPEMVDPKHVDHRIDLYALGIILFEMLEGTVPFSADSPYRVLEMHLRQPLPLREDLRRAVPAPVWAVIEKLCAKSRDDRFPSAEALLVELNRLLRDAGDLEH